VQNLSVKHGVDSAQIEPKYTHADGW
jgi:hypothetical protein